jgi:hypothetical protein
MTGLLGIRPIRDDMFNFVRNDLVQQEGIHTRIHTKAVAHTEDVTFLVFRLYSREYSDTFGNMRKVLNLTLYMLLMVDLCGRGGDIVRNPLRPEHMSLR